MKRKTKYGILILVLLLAVGFAAVSTSLVINGTANFGVNIDDFEVIFTSAIVDGEDQSTTAISEDGKTLTFTTSELAIMNDTSILNFEVTNNSTQYDAKISMECVANGEHANDYYKIEKNLPEVINAASKENGNVKVILLKTSVEEIEETFTCTISAVAQERETVGENIIVGPPFYAFGLPTVNSPADYTTLGKNVFAKLDAENSLSVCIYDNGLFCMKNNEFDNSVILLKQHFGESTCTTNGANVNCKSDLFSCNVDTHGSVDCYDLSDGSVCYVPFNGIVDCR